MTKRVKSDPGTRQYRQLQQCMCDSSICGADFWNNVTRYTALNIVHACFVCLSAFVIIVIENASAACIGCGWCGYSLSTRWVVRENEVD